LFLTEWAGVSDFKNSASFRKSANNAPRNAKGSGGKGPNDVHEPKMRDVKDAKGKKPEGEASKPRIVDTAEGRNERWNQMKKSGEWESVSGYDKSTLRNKDTGDLAQKSIEKWEIEVYNKREDHIGVIKPSDGKFHPELKVPGRVMRK